MIMRRDQAFSIVCNIRTSITTVEMVGTGIFLEKNNVPYLVTAAHVAKDTNENTIIVVGDSNCSCKKISLKALANEIKWITHPVADLAVLQMTPNDIVSSFISGRCLPYDHFNLTKQCISRDTELTVIGFPHGLGIGGAFSPLTFRSFAASSFLTLARADTYTPSYFFCMENPSVGGYSGGPVFDLAYYKRGLITMAGEKTICHGIIHGTMSDNTGGKLALVTPCFYLADIVY